MRLTYRLSPKFISARYVLTGSSPTESQHFNVDDVKTTPEIRELYEAVKCGSYAPLGEADRFLTEADTLEYLQKSKDRQDATAAVFQAKVDAAAVEVEQKLVAIESGALSEDDSIITWNECVQAVGRFSLKESDQFRSVQVSINAICEVRKARRVIEFEEMKKAEALEKQRRSTVVADQDREKEKTKESKRLWIKDFGSDRLKQSEILGYENEEAYLTQRAEKEYPDFELDYFNQSRWSSCTYPSLDAMDALTDLPNDFKIVKLTQPHDFDSDDEDYIFEDCEAIILEGYLKTGATLVFRDFA